MSTSRESGRTFEARRVIGAFTPVGGVDRQFGGDGVLGVAGADPRTAVQRNGDRRLPREEGRRWRPVPDRGPPPRRARPVRPDFRARRLRRAAREIIGLDVDLDRRGRIVIGAGALTTHGSGGMLLVRPRGGEAPRPTAS